jgi:hypothetical protein
MTKFCGLLLLAPVFLFTFIFFSAKRLVKLSSNCEPAPEAGSPLLRKPKVKRPTSQTQTNPNWRTRLAGRRAYALIPTKCTCMMSTYLYKIDII